MKTELKAKFLQHLSQKHDDRGFTLIELLVVIIIIGILSAIALPSFLNQANKAKQSEARQYVGSMNRAQQAYYLEKDLFAPQASFTELGLGIPTQSKNYGYSIRGGGNNETTVVNAASAVKGAFAPIKAYVGGVSFTTITNNGSNESTTLATLCEGTKPPANSGDNATQNPTFSSNAAPVCAFNYTKL